MLDEERTLRTAAEGPATPRGHAIDRPASARLDDQQRAAYDHAIGDGSRLKVITGVPGAGKTTLIDDVAAAYESAGYRVRGTAVSYAACEVLRSETPLAVENTAKLIRSWEPDEDDRVRRGAALTERDVLVIDEVSMLGSEQGARILEAACAAGATVIAIGDDRQFLSVSRGNALGEMSRAVGASTVDLEKTRRQAEPWMRTATEAVRRGDVRKALDAYRAEDCIVETTTQDEARRALAARWGELTAAGAEVGVNVATNAERLAVGALLRDEWRAQGKLEGPDVTLATMDGPTVYAIGDRVVVRETVREAELFNGSLATIRGVDPAGRLALRTADGRDVILDVEAHPGVQHAYAGTAYRAQGATHDHELTLATATVNNRGLTVGMTRHRESYGLFVSDEAVGGYEGLVARGGRLEHKVGALGIVDRAAAIVREREAASEREAAAVARKVAAAAAVRVGRPTLATALAAIAESTVAPAPAKRITLEGTLTRDPRLTAGPKTLRVSLGLAVAGTDGATSTRLVIVDAKPGATWPDELRRGDRVRVGGVPVRESRELDGETRTVAYVRADRIAVAPRDREAARDAAPSRDAPPHEPPAPGRAAAVPAQPNVEGTREFYVRDWTVGELRDELSEIVMGFRRRDGYTPDEYVAASRMRDALADLDRGWTVRTLGEDLRAGLGAADGFLAALPEMVAWNLEREREAARALRKPGLTEAEERVGETMREMRDARSRGLGRGMGR